MFRRLESLEIGVVVEFVKKAISKSLYSLGKAAAKAKPPESMLTEWSKLSNLAAAREAERIATSDTLVFPNRVATRAWVFSGPNSMQDEGLVLEFGVHRGGSLKQLAAAGHSVVGFDSFEGIRDPWSKPGKVQGSMNEDGIIPAELLKEPRVTVVKGWVEDTLTPFLEDNPGQVKLVHLDLDVYPPTRFVLGKIAGRLVSGSLLVFDDFFGHIGWQNHSHRAFHESFDEDDFTVAAISPSVVVFRSK